MKQYDRDYQLLEEKISKLRAQADILIEENSSFLATKPHIAQALIFFERENNNKSVFMPKSPLIRQEKKKKIALKTPLESQKHTEKLV